ncbi:hypothetical protein HMPREF2758_03380 [Facklamia sp. HMSC062C11]|uniref:hypothetical protein n=1 Tax=Facklamia sp. HMSC062C11 TaxID=1739262 RepID=UPI0008A63049|nr:hypothetical protein [Facklamia sp. HMSC062C11]OFL64632.1 hypothetical protein HMPREF2758_03380 [Facklamia sp. HMSC062C11]
MKHKIVTYPLLLSLLAGAFQSLTPIQASESSTADSTEEVLQHSKAGTKSKDEHANHGHHHDHDHDEENEDLPDHIQSIKSSFVDNHHHGHRFKRANFIPEEILNPDDSTYQAPKEVADYQGFYQGALRIEDLDLDLKIILSIEEDGLFNLAYYFVQDEAKQGQRFYEDGQGELQSRPAIYQDLVIMTGGLKVGEGGLYGGLIRKTLSPVVLLGQKGQPIALYPYTNMAYDLRETYSKYRIYQNVGLYLAEGNVYVDVNHLIGLDSKNSYQLELAPSKEKSEDHFLVEKHSYEILQESFDRYLVDHNDFAFHFETANDFLQEILAMHLQTNRSFPLDTKVEMVDPSHVKVDLGEGRSIKWTFMIDQTELYVYDGKSLYLAEDLHHAGGIYHADQWLKSKN